MRQKFWVCRVRWTRRATEEKAEITKVFQDATSTVDATGLCQFLTFGVGLEEMLPQLSAATGVEYTLEELVHIGERIWNPGAAVERTGRLHRQGRHTLPKRILEEPIPSGPAKGEVNRLGEMLPEYYELRGWDKDGIISEAKKKELGLE